VRGAALGLRTPGRRREDDIAVVGHGTIRRGASLATPARRADPVYLDRFIPDCNIPS
jgi:hypothetical protein